MIMIEPPESPIHLRVSEMRGPTKCCDSSCQSLAYAKMIGLPGNFLAQTNKALCDAPNCGLPSLLGRPHVKLYVS